LIIAKTIIGKGIPEVAGSQKDMAKAEQNLSMPPSPALGLPVDQHFFVSDEVRAYFLEHKSVCRLSYNAGKKAFGEWKTQNPEKAALLESRSARPSAADLLVKDSHVSDGRERLRHVLPVATFFNHCGGLTLCYCGKR